MATDTPRIPEQGVATLPDEAWERARRRAEIISPLAQSETVGHEAADMAAQALGLSRRQVYVLIRRARQGSGLVTDLGHCCKVSDEAAFCLIQRPYISKTLLTRRIS
ncbi:helix-turn-helix domain containing protein, partial [Klebsiella pneumoniae]|nr:helix-turn-helix domain containing protein [Klebsiella pneumoniae]